MRKMAFTAMFTALSGAALTGTMAAGQAAAAPSVNMEAVVKAAMWDPYKPDQSITPGSGDSVKVVEQALAAKNLLDGKQVDGHFGTSTVTAYAKYQKSLGHSGLAASGLPGTGSLTELGKGRYTVTAAISVGSKTTMDGQTVNKRTADMIKAAEQRAGVDFTVTQGSYNAGGVGASGGTHDGGGAVDISVKNISNPTAAVKALREVGFAAWHRTPSQGDWVAHIHGIAISDTDMSPQAQAQAGDYFKGLNGLANHNSDDGPQVKKVTWEEFKRG
ncbi:peptidoglycan-binding domain-containing protein [Amycolatopsis magusensis]|uniref:peptidoglycan-binding domain-containing protein n=1 Tax=Amycolatopsis magusensis TaxID=882444 RepID=UPI0024A9F5B1|nr:peptidoglycan-binding domain-containing protein [Amycolatopsis magusensis]MDI5979311.1 peptidoglycan-binding domain-containing protein [Amycolatopsis magusensis]